MRNVLFVLVLLTGPHIMAGSPPQRAIEMMMNGRVLAGFFLLCAFVAFIRQKYAWGLGFISAGVILGT